MGRTTADTFLIPLPDRINVVITSSGIYRNGFSVYTSFHDALMAVNSRVCIPNGYVVHKVFVIGGAILGNVAIRHRRCRGVYLNMISNNYNCDVKLSKDFMEHLENQSDS